MDLRALIVMTSLLGALAFATPAAASKPLSKRISASVPSAPRAGERVEIRGRVADAPRATKVLLEEHDSAGSWKSIASVRVRAGRFTLTWRPLTAQRLAVRLTVRHHGRVLTRSNTVQINVGRPLEYCPEPPAPTNLPSGDGWIYGGVYDSGGPAPGIFACRSGPYEVSATGEAGTTVASEMVLGRESFVLVVPQGLYTVHAPTCGFSEEVSVAPGEGSKVEAVCSIP
jgi:hypothetical protein